MSDSLKFVERKLKELYGKEEGKQTNKEIEKLLKEHVGFFGLTNEKWSEKDVALITYPDSFQEDIFPTLKTLNQFLTETIGNTFSIVHILPFFPFSSDRGFSVQDYFKVNDRFGDWEDIGRIASNYRLMSDFVLNHISSKHEWFQKFISGDSEYEDYFIWFAEENIPWEDLKKVTRSRSTPLVTPFQTKKGRRYVWTTYSVGKTTDQIDVNYKNPRVFIGMLRVLLNLLKNGVRIIRFDGASGIWKELGTSCRHLPQTHTLISLFREIATQVYPSALFITEATTTSQEENKSYFGNGNNETHLIYNFPLAPLLMHSLYSSSAEHLSRWAEALRVPSATTTLVNCLDIHDGINIHGVRGILSDLEIENIFFNVRERGGEFSYRSLPDGSKIVKEMHITWWSAVNGRSSDLFDLKLRRFLMTRAVAMSIIGIPSIYYLSLFGAENDRILWERTGVARNINRTDFDYAALKRKLADKDSRESRVLTAVISLVRRRATISQFHPNSPQKIVNVDKRVFAVERGEKNARLLALHNISFETVGVTHEGKNYRLEPYSFLWKEL